MKPYSKMTDKELLKAVENENGLVGKESQMYMSIDELAARFKAKVKELAKVREENKRLIETNKGLWENLSKTTTERNALLEWKQDSKDWQDALHAAQSRIRDLEERINDMIGEKT